LLGVRLSCFHHGKKVLSDQEGKVQMKEAMFYDPFAEGELRCNLCNHRCKIKDLWKEECSCPKEI